MGRCDFCGHDPGHSALCLMRARTSPPRLPEEETIQAAFEAFHERHPGVYMALRELALKAVRRGRRRIGIGMLWEVLRWNLWIDTGEEQMLNNNYRSRYARMMMDLEPELAGVFELRELRSE